MSRPPRRKTIEAEEFILKDSQGKTRARLGIEGEEPFLALLDPRGKPRAALAIHEGNPYMLLYNHLGESRLRLSLRGDWPELVMCDRGGLSETSLSVGKNGSFLSFGGPQSLQVSTGADGATLVFRNSAAGNGTRVSLRVKKGGPKLTLHSATGGPRIELSVRTQKPVFAFLDKRGKRAVSLSIVGGNPVLQVKSNGRIRSIRLSDIDPGS